MYVVGIYYKCLMEMLLMSTHNIYFHGEIRKNIISFQYEKSSLSGAMDTYYFSSKTYLGINNIYGNNPKYWDI